MVKKLVCLLSVLVIGISQSAFAVPSVKMLGNNKLNSASVKPVTSTPNRKADNKINNKATMAKVAKTPIAKVTTTSSATQGRIPAITGIKSINTAKVKPVIVNNDSINKPTTSGVTEDKLNEVVERIENLETQNENAITDVVENESGTYVTDVAVDGNKLSVNKTRLLYAPVRNGNSEEISGDAEIWIVK